MTQESRRTVLHPSSSEPTDKEDSSCHEFVGWKALDFRPAMRRRDGTLADADANDGGPRHVNWPWPRSLSPRARRRTRRLTPRHEAATERVSDVCFSVLPV